ncbi:hypothetical protein [Ideonella alba]|uniref:Uncharacterized protein n=1 Tax=Ideonella alba TaxID=2824118 RepID=A0A941BBR7_9BURK|nr:hypothetical protein [Ideonella alba]MBQ0931170.1 hypothetical protein [Ideonella alba]
MKKTAKTKRVAPPTEPKTEPLAEPTTEPTPEPSPAIDQVRVLETIECDSLARSCRITYELGVRLDGSAVMRVARNSGAGMFCDQWVSVDDVLRVLNLPAHREGISSTAFRPLYLGRSSNSHSFLMAALRHEEAVIPHPTRPRNYQAADPRLFEARVRRAVDPETGEGAETMRGIAGGEDAPTDIGPVDEALPHPRP